MLTAGVKPDEWAIVELMGHRQRAGRVSEIQQFGATMLRIERFAPDEEEPFSIEDYGGTAIFCLHRCTERMARAAEADMRRQQILAERRRLGLPPIPTEGEDLSLIHTLRRRRYAVLRSPWYPYH